MNQPEAFLAGRRVGRLSLSPALNPHPDGSQEAAAWLTGWNSAAEEAANYANQKSRKEWWSDRVDFDNRSPGR
jgi:hypothetical protein